MRREPYIPINTRVKQWEESSARTVALQDLRYLLTFRSLDAWGMDALTDTLLTLIPELAQNPYQSETFHD